LIINCSPGDSIEEISIVRVALLDRIPVKGRIGDLYLSKAIVDPTPSCIVAGGSDYPVV
jgi:hypothetical protein